MKNQIKCKDCCFYWFNEDYRRNMCNWEARCPNDYPPCEEEEDEGDDIYACEMESLGNDWW